MGNEFKRTCTSETMMRLWGPGPSARAVAEAGATAMK